MAANLMPLHLPANVQAERDAAVAYLRRQAEGCTKRAEALGEEDPLATLQKAMAHTLDVLADRLQRGAHRAT